MSFKSPDLVSPGKTATLQLKSGYPRAYLTVPTHPAGEITVKINYPEHHTINSTESSYGLGKPDNRVSDPVGGDIFLLTTAFSSVHQASLSNGSFLGDKMAGLYPNISLPSSAQVTKCISLLRLAWVKI